jgi:hypothetical protein
MAEHMKHCAFGQEIQQNAIGIENSMSNMAQTARDCISYAGAFAQGLGDGAAMVANAATYHYIRPLNRYVHHVVAVNGGLYRYANGSAHIAIAALYSSVIPNINTWITNPALYEVGSTTVSAELYELMQATNMSTIEMGTYMVSEYGYLGALGRTAIGQFANTVSTGFTPSGYLLVFIGGDILRYERN